MYTLTELKQSKIAIHCPTESEAREIAKLVETSTRMEFTTLSSGISCYGGELCIDAYEGFRGYADIEYYKDKGYTIVSASTFLESQKRRGFDIPYWPDWEEETRRHEPLDYRMD